VAMQEGPPRKWPREEKESRRTPSTLSNNIQATSESSEERLKSQRPYTVSIPQSTRDSILKGLITGYLCLAISNAYR
jgi:hypothetical protein